MTRKCSSMDAPDSPARRRGPKPLLSRDLEIQLVQWVLTRQSSGRRVARDDVITQAQEMLQQEEEAKSVGMGWCNRFVARHPELNLRSGSLSNIMKGNPPSNEEELKVIVNDGKVVNVHEGESVKAPEMVQHVELKEVEGGEVEETTEPVKTRKYNRKHMEAAVEMYLAGRPMSEVTQRFPLLHQRTIRRRVLRVQRGEVDRRRGPRPLLEGGPEQELVAWILDMQSRGACLTKHDILARANDKYRELNGGGAGEDRLKEGWLRRFKERHPVLSGRATGKVHHEEKGLVTEEKMELLSGDSELASSTQSFDGQQELMQAFDRIGGQLKRSDPAIATAENTATTSKRQKTEEKTEAARSTRQGSILPERRQSEKDENVRKLDTIMKSNQRLEEMQRQQLEMLKQLCASSNVMSNATRDEQNIESTK